MHPKFCLRIYSRASWGLCTQLHPPRLTWVILSSFLFTRLDVFYFSLCQGSFCTYEGLCHSPNSCHNAGCSGTASCSRCLKAGSLLAEGGVSILSWRLLWSKSTPKEEVGLPVSRGQEATGGWCGSLLQVRGSLEDSEPGPPGSFSPSFWHFSYPKPEPLCSALQKTDPIVMTKGSGSSIHACVHYTDHHCLISSWGKRTNSLAFWVKIKEKK